MTCIKTGFNGYIVQQQQYVHGDLYQIDNVYYLRISSMYHTRPDWLDRLHIVVSGYEEWFDKYREDGPSTMIATRKACAIYLEDNREESSSDTTQTG